MYGSDLVWDDAPAIHGQTTAIIHPQ
jgi:hypothetical protein